MNARKDAKYFRELAEKQAEEVFEARLNKILYEIEEAALEGEYTYSFEEGMSEAIENALEALGFKIRYTGNARYEIEW